MTLRWWIGTVVSLAVGVGCALPAAAQIGRGALVGDVSDQAGSAVPGASVTVTSVATRTSRDATTAADGSYAFQGLAPGIYRMRIQLVGFRAAVREGVRIATGETVRIDVRLELGVAEAVTVTADAPLLRSETSSLGQVARPAEDCRAAAERPQLHHARRRWRRASRCRRGRRCPASTAAGRGPMNTCSTASPSCSPSLVRSPSFPTSMRFRSSRSRATARRPSSAASTAVSST